MKTENEIKRGIKTTINPMMRKLSESFYSGSSQLKCKELYDVVKSQLKASDFISQQNIIEYKGYKLKVRFAGQKNW